MPIKSKPKNDKSNYIYGSKKGGKVLDDIESPDDDEVMSSDSELKTDDDEPDFNENMDEVENEDALENEGDEEPDEDDDDKGIDSDKDMDDKREDYEGEDCLYRFTKKTDIADDDYVEQDDYFEDDVADTTLYVPNDQRQTKPVLTRYERVRILGERARQLSLGAKPMVLGTAGLDPKEIARMELNVQKIPFFIERPLPGGKRERWHVSELKIIN